MAAGHGVRAVRVATHVTEADIAEQHVGFVKKLGMESFGFLMMGHMAPPEKVAEQALLFQSFGADVVYVADSAGTMLPADVRARIAAVVAAVKVPVGFHAHNNLALAVANSAAALEAGASYLDGTCRGLGAGAGNAQLEVLTGVLDKLGYQTSIDFYKVMDVAEKIVGPMMKRPQVIGANALDDGVRRSLLELPPLHRACRGAIRSGGARHPGRAGPAPHGRRPGRHDHRRRLPAVAGKGSEPRHEDHPDAGGGRRRALHRLHHLRPGLSFAGHRHRSEDPPRRGGG